MGSGWKGVWRLAGGGVVQQCPFLARSFVQLKPTTSPFVLHVTASRAETKNKRKEGTKEGDGGDMGDEGVYVRSYGSTPAGGDCGAVNDDRRESDSAGQSVCTSKRATIWSDKGESSGLRKETGGQITLAPSQAAGGKKGTGKEGRRGEKTGAEGKNAQRVFLRS
ncbi:hypothetical protein Dda_7688 [Drechslerella dactyloides]|uniref:Uncharacterized protein n=1 Tax=Drechslerella dactyloides TaxID=74499 RepID=A0AAD6ISM2_DREDA|nr:hypothetical protein Dda_7688 [Drechslerella dactyloides]